MFEKIIPFSREDKPEQREQVVRIEKEDRFFAERKKAEIIPIPLPKEEVKAEVNHEKGSSQSVKKKPTRNHSRSK